MTRRDELIAMRGRDLIELCQKLGVKVNASKTSLKEAKAGVVERILFAESGESITNEDVVDSATNPMKDELIEALCGVSEIYPDIEVKTFEALGAYDLFRDGKFIASIAPWDDGVGIASIATDFVDYDSVACELEAILNS